MQNPHQMRSRRLASRLDLTGGEVGDSPHFEILFDLGPHQPPRAVICDKGYDSKRNRAVARRPRYRASHSTEVECEESHKNSSRSCSTDCAQEIEQLVGKLKRFKRIALRCEKTARNFASFVAFALAMVLIKFVHTA